MIKLPIYMDYSVTTPVDPRVAEQMIPYLTEIFGNPASRSHSFGWSADQAVETAREQVAALVKAVVNGDLTRRVPHNINRSFNFVEGESLLMAIKDIAVSSGSACTSASLEPSYVLRALSPLWDMYLDGIDLGTVQWGKH